VSREASSFEGKHKSRRSSDPVQPGWEGVSRILLGLVDAGLLGVIFLAPLFMGGRGEIGRLVYISLVCGTAVCWLARQCLLVTPRWRWSGLEWILLAGVLLVVLQLVPLPPGVLQSLSPQVPGLLPLWTTPAAAETHLGVWNQLSLRRKPRGAAWSRFSRMRCCFWCWSNGSGTCTTSSGWCVGWPSPP